jgi:DNA-damage-inducible protein D
MTGLNVQSKDLKGQTKIEREHIDNNAAVREMLAKRGISPENLPPAEDIKKLQRKLDSDEKKVLKDAQSKKDNKNKNG